MEEIKTYIVGIGGTDMDTVDTYRVVGTEEQIRKHLAKVCTEMADGDKSAYGSFKPEDFVSNGSLHCLSVDEGCFAGYVDFRDSHIDITAHPEETPIYLGDDGDDEIPIEEVIRNFNERAIFIVFGDGSDALLQDNGYTIEDAKKFAKEGCVFHYDGPGPDANVASTVKLSDKERDQVYREVWAEHVAEDVMCRLHDTWCQYLEGTTDEDWKDFCENIAICYAFNGDYDCNLSYWNQLDSLIDRARIDIYSTELLNKKAGK